MGGSQQLQVRNCPQGLPGEKTQTPRLSVTLFCQPSSHQTSIKHPSNTHQTPIKHPSNTCQVASKRTTLNIRYLITYNTSRSPLAPILFLKLLYNSHSTSYTWTSTCMHAWVHKNNTIKKTTNRLPQELHRQPHSLLHLSQSTNLPLYPLRESGRVHEPFAGLPHVQPHLSQRHRRPRGRAEKVHRTSHVLHGTHPSRCVCVCVCVCVYVCVNV